jgi:hypothetical protein
MSIPNLHAALLDIEGRRVTAKARQLETQQKESKELRGRVFMP